MTHQYLEQRGKFPAAVILNGLPSSNGENARGENSLLGGEVELLDGRVHAGQSAPKAEEVRVPARRAVIAAEPPTRGKRYHGCFVGYNLTGVRSKRFLPKSLPRRENTHETSKLSSSLALAPLDRREEDQKTHGNT